MVSQKGLTLPAPISIPVACNLPAVDSTMAGVACRASQHQGVIKTPLTDSAAHLTERKSSHPWNTLIDWKHIKSTSQLPWETVSNWRNINNLVLQFKQKIIPVYNDITGISLVIRTCLVGTWIGFVENCFVRIRPKNWTPSKGPRPTRDFPDSKTRLCIA